MRFVGAGLVTLLLASPIAACSGSNDTGSNGGWRVSGSRIRIIGAQHPCRTPSPVLDTFSATPTPDPNCTPAPGVARASAAPTSTPSQHWYGVHTEDYRSATRPAWHPIYTKYTAPPGTGIYQPMVHATQQPMPTPFTTPTPSPLPTLTPIPTWRPAPTNPPTNVTTSAPAAYAIPSATP
jgi:hypothetical protein